jgi:molybdopterin-synthase adenylyltransferase
MKYHRQELVIGKEAQQLLKKSKVTIVGLGALGTVVANLLARAGINLILIDRDIIEENNLQRQILYTEADLNKSKALTAKNKLKLINKEIKLEAKEFHLNHKNINQISSDLVIDCTDNLKTRFLINDYCKKNNLLWIFGSAIKEEGQVKVFLPNEECLNCFLTETNLDTCELVGVLNSITSIIGSLQADLAVRILTNKDFNKNLTYVNLKNNKFRSIKINKNDNCKACNGNYKHLDKEDSKLIKFCGSNKYQITGKPLPINKIKKINEKFNNITLFEDGRALIKANSEAEAQTIYSKHIGN